MPYRLRTGWPVLLLVALVFGVLSWPTRAHGQQPAPDGALLQELAERALTPPYPGPTGEPQPRARLLPGAAPETLPFTLPRPQGSRLLGSVIRPFFGAGPAGPATGESVEIILDVLGSPDDVLAFFEGALTEQGWSAPPLGRGPRPGGFLPSALPTNLTLCRGEDGPSLNLVVFPRPPEPNDVRLTVQSGVGAPGPCSAAPGQRPPSPPDAELLPPLEPPAGVQTQGAGGGGGPFSRSSDAVAETELSVAELEVHYARQLAAAGWQRLGGGGDEAAAWSRWQAAGEGERPGLLVVMAGPGPNRRSLHLQATLNPRQALPGPVPVPR